MRFSEIARKLLGGPESKWGLGEKRFLLFELLANYEIAGVARS